MVFMCTFPFVFSPLFCMGVLKIKVSGASCTLLDIVGSSKQLVPFYTGDFYVARWIYVRCVGDHA